MSLSMIFVVEDDGAVVQESTLWLDHINPKRPHRRKINQHGGCCQVAFQGDLLYLQHILLEYQVFRGLLVVFFEIA